MITTTWWTHSTGWSRSVSVLTIRDWCWDNRWLVRKP
jgi:hypothetical protein